eukprot:TRINITY_DN10244_c0_g1_i1.p1 TRINITY_DN10244_c0_g1~~TRINITY_DN10244_c0_g1_i1.p1  ORF type:complete len:248 (+),score=30.72 TRINITY_DN10244_c0_g1_i1:87-830(+)
MSKWDDDGGGGGWWNSNWEPTEQGPRTRLTRNVVPGRVIEWKGQYGWIEPQVVIEHPELSKNKNRIFIHAEDCLPKWRNLAVGSLVEFHLYSDGQGLGAEECYARKVLRLTLPWSAAKAVFGEGGEFLPDFDRRANVTTKAYEWMFVDGSASDMAFLLLEVWGHPQNVIAAVLEICKKDRRLVANMLVPEGRLWKVNLPQLWERCRGATLAQDLTIIDPMPCRTLTIKGTRGECGSALSALILQVCD